MSATAMNMDVIRRCPLFKLLDDEQFAHIEPRLQIIKLAAGERPDIALAIMKAVAKILAERLQDTSADLADVCA